MKVKALITLVVGRGTEVVPNEIADVSETEAKKLIERGFAEEVVKQTTPRNRNTNQNKLNFTPPQEPDEEEEPEDNESPEDGDENDSYGESGQ